MSKRLSRSSIAIYLSRVSLVCARSKNYARKRATAPKVNERNSEGEGNLIGKKLIITGPKKGRVKEENIY